MVSREKLEFFVFASETVVEIMAMAAGTYPTIGSQLSFRRNPKAIVKGTLINSLDNQLKEFYVQKGARNKPGIATGNGSATNASNWLQGTEKEWGNVPSTIANTLRGQNFNNFDEFRVAFWKAIGNDPNLRKSFSPIDWSDMIKYGKAPKVQPSQIYKSKDMYQLHHRIFIKDGGKVYNMDNILITTPKYHMQIHNPHLDF